MTDIDNLAEIIPRKLSYTSITSENRSRTSSIVDNYAVVPTAINEIDEIDEEDIPLFSSGKIYKNLVILSIAFVLLFTAYAGILSLQSSLNTVGNVGVNSLIVINVLILFSSLFLTGVSLDIFGLKWTIIIGEIGYILYIIANIRPLPILMYTTAGFLGLISAPLWTSQATYISRLAYYHAHHTQKRAEHIVSLFFGIFFAIFGTSGIWGNLMSYLILQQSNHPQRFNCGIYFDPLSKTNTHESDDVSEKTRYILCGVFAGMGILSMILLLVGLDQIRLAKPQRVTQSLKKSIEVIQSLFRWKYIDQLFLVPITMWTMIESTFLLAQFTRAFITCLVGIRFIGLVLICNGICTAIASYIFGELVKYIGRLGCFIIAAILNYSMIFLMYFWEPAEDQIYVLYIMAGIWGIAGAAWQSQVIAAYTVFYSKTDPTAIAKYRLWKAVGSLVTYGYASYITIHLTLILLFTFLTVSMIFYGIVEIHIRWKNNTKKSDTMLDRC